MRPITTAAVLAVVAGPADAQFGPAGRLPGHGGNPAWGPGNRLPAWPGGVPGGGLPRPGLNPGFGPALPGVGGGFGPGFNPPGRFGPAFGPGFNPAAGPVAVPRDDDRRSSGPGIYHVPPAGFSGAARAPAYVPSAPVYQTTARTFNGVSRVGRGWLAGVGAGAAGLFGLFGAARSGRGDSASMGDTDRRFEARRAAAGRAARPAGDSDAAADGRAAEADAAAVRAAWAAGGFAGTIEAGTAFTDPTDEASNFRYAGAWFVATCADQATADSFAERVAGLSLQTVVEGQFRVPESGGVAAA